ncbi:MAG TPA: 3-oxoacyl-[acyl-carrier-protein] reductase [Firmicutes bacterium]|nr:3-oxoacyl-[acyl-carrier-protein] reductase [Caldisericia bacterium]HDH63145.1 3-oxoacyl-[acyl-carrier-protein] reductase [Bacillota bacterium]
MRESKTALITGGARGIGRDISLSLSEKGFDIGINFRKSKKEAEQLKREIEERFNRKVLLLKGDVSRRRDVQGMVRDFIKEFGRIDVLVNNAGITKDNLVIRLTENDFREVIDVNLIGTFLMTKEVIPYMLRRRSGSIINISSIVGIFGNKGQTNYSASKAGIIGFSKSLAKEVASRNIRVNVIAPGFIETDMTDGLPDEIKEKILKNIPLGRFGKPKEVSHLVTFLASDESSYMTGQVFLIDGGLSLGFQI